MFKKEEMECGQCLDSLGGSSLVVCVSVEMAKRECSGRRSVCVYWNAVIKYFYGQK